MTRRFLVASLLWFCPLWSSERTTVTILATTDLHGYIFPFDYSANRPANIGLAKAATIIRGIRREKPHALLIDCGDAIEGSPLAFLHAKASPNPIMKAMNELDYDGMVVGNHEFDFGLEPMLKAKSDAQFEWLSANVTPAATAAEATALRNREFGRAADSVEQRVFTPMLVEEVDGVSVAIIGLTTPAIPSWERPENIASYRFESPVTAAREWVKYAHEVRHADVVIIAAHLGLERSLDTAQPFPGQLAGENAVYQIAQAIRGIDGIIFGHTHQELSARSINDVILVQPKQWGQSVAEMTFTMEREADNGPWKIVGKTSRVIPVTDDIAPDPEILKVAQSYHEATQKYLDTSVTETATAVAILDAIHEVQLAKAQADVSFTAVLDKAALIPPGPMTVRQFFAIYPYENTLLAVEGTGKMVRDVLEAGAESASGVTYEVDPSKPVGQRVVNLRWRGEPLDPQQKLRIAVNSYRKPAIFRDAKVLWQSTEGIRQLMIDYYTKKKPIGEKQPQINTDEHR